MKSINLRKKLPTEKYIFNGNNQKIKLLIGLVWLGNMGYRFQSFSTPEIVLRELNSKKNCQCAYRIGPNGKITTVSYDELKLIWDSASYYPENG